MTAAIVAVAVGFVSAAIGAICGFVGGRRDGRDERRRLAADLDVHTGEHPLPHLEPPTVRVVARHRQQRPYDWATEAVLP